MLDIKEKVKITLTCEQLDAIIEYMDYTNDLTFAKLDKDLAFIHNELKEVLNETHYGRDKTASKIENEKWINAHENVVWLSSRKRA